MTTALFAGRRDHWPEWETPLREAIHAVAPQVRLIPEPGEGTVDYLIYAPSGPFADFTRFQDLKAVLSLWAGVEQIAGLPGLAAPLCRMVDPGLSEGMVEWVTGHVLRHHLGMDLHLQGQDGTWREHEVPPLARNRKVGILGLGALGSACANALRALNFDVAGWSRTEKTLPGIACFFGTDSLHAVLHRSEIVVLLLPQTPATRNILDADALAALPDGAFIVNPGRGTLIDDDALLAALDRNIRHATLDVFRTEPLPPDHPYWTHPRVTVTPHIASATRPETAAHVIAENIRRSEAGEPLLHLVDPSLGY